MKKTAVIFCVIFIMLITSGCKQNDEPVPQDAGSSATQALAQPDHTLSETDNLVDDPQYPTCGNTITTVTRISDNKVFTFEGGDSVSITGIIENLVYDPDKTCKCDSTEYTVKTEFSDNEYSVSVREGYVRTTVTVNGGNYLAQANLTQEQLDSITQIINNLK